MKRLSSLLPVFLISLLLASCSANATPKTAATAQPDTGPKVSFASPDPGANVPFGPVQVMILSEDLRGTAQVEVLVNGVSAATVPSPNTTQTSVIVEYIWNPAAPGQYVLQAHAQNNAGTWGDFASLELTVAEAEPAADTPSEGEAPTEERLPTATATEVIATQPGPTETPIVPNVPATPTRSGISVAIQFSELRMYKYGSACEPQQNGVFVDVQGLDKNAIGGVMLFFQPVDKNTGQAWTWSTGLWLELFDSGLYGRGFSTVHMVNKGQAFPYIPAIVNYQIAISDKGGTIIYRSDVYSNLEVASCG
jgi:hypothetical protein